MKIKKGEIKIIIPAGEAASGLNVSGTNLGAVLGQHQINISTFCKEFNEASQNDFEKGVPLPLRVTKFSDKTYKLTYRSPNFFDMVFAALDKNTIAFVDLYDLCRHFCDLRNLPFDDKTISTYFGVLSSRNQRINILRKK